jgi:tetratricopeptide (TPR) repeat protein
MTAAKSGTARWKAHLAAYRAGDAHYGAGRFLLALRAFSRALILAPGDPDALWAIGNCYTALSQPRLAERAFRKAMASADPEDIGALRYNLGNALYDQRRVAAAAWHYRRAPRQGPVAPLARRNLQLATGKRSNSAVESDANVPALRASARAPQPEH